jgi:hypothetical protein
MVGSGIFFQDPDPYKKLRLRIQEVKKHTDPTDPDPEHCFNFTVPYGVGTYFTYL